MLALFAVFVSSEAQGPLNGGSGGMHMQAPKSSKTDSKGKIRTYYIAADEVQWNYMPTMTTYLLRGENEIPPVPKAKSNTYLKAMYREYTSDSFTTLKPRAAEWEHLGILGPPIRAEVGDVIKVVFKNNTRFICTMHPHGLAYERDSEGAYYSESATAPPDPTRKGNAVNSGEVFTYTWTVPERAGPGPGDPSSILWMYHSHFNESRDMNSGLFGPIIISRKGSTKPDGLPKDVDREFVVAFATFEENTSGYFMQNIVHDQQYSTAMINDPNFVKTLEYFTL
ncbi:MAG TPA: multicopper oxidase domain-containing protein, partial [Edaphobacter sp.]